MFRKKMFAKSSKALGLSILLSGAVAIDALAVVEVVPEANTTTDANMNNAYPFSWSLPMTYQQVYSASEFGSQPLWLTSVAFRPDIDLGTAFSASASNFQLTLSTTSKPVDGLSSIFAENVGTDVSLMYSGTLTLSSNNTVSGSVKQFDAVINFTTPFLYNPSLGNLLMEIRSSGMQGTEFDAAWVTGDPVSRVLYKGSNTATVGTTSTLGLVTQFTAQDVTPAPEPTSALTGFAIAGVVAFSRFRRRAPMEG